MSLARFTLLATASLGLAACASPGQVRSQAHLLTPGEVAAQQALASTAAQAAWPDPDWWRALDDPQLDALIQEALTHNPDLAIAAARARRADAAAGLADAARQPTVNASASVSGAHLPETLLPTDMGGGHFGWIKYGYASFHWGLDLWGGQRAAWEAAVDQAHAAAIDQQAARLALSTGVARAWAQLGYAARQVELSQAELARATRANRLTAQRVDAGIDSRLQQQRSAAEVAQARQRLAASRHEVDAARLALAVLLGQGPDRGLTLQPPAPLHAPALTLPDKLPVDLLGRRPDLVAARWRVQASDKGIAAARARFLPNISLGAMLGLVADGSTSLLQLPARFFQVAPAVSLPIFSGGKLRANLADRAAARDLAVAHYNKTLIGALNEVAVLAREQQALRQQAAAQDQVLAASRSAWQLAEQRYQAGIGSFLQALDVRRQLLQAERAMAALHARQVDVSIRLVQAMGGGFQSTLPAPSLAPASHQETRHD